MSDEIATGLRGAGVLIPLAEFSVGDPPHTRGTGLSKSSVAEAIRVAVDSGILRRDRRRSRNGGSLTTEYFIDWTHVAKLAKRR